MKKKLFKITALVGLVAMLGMGLAGCKKSECYWCNETKRCKMVYFSLIGEKNTCKECEKLLSPISENLKELDEQENGK